jgi:uncharacterized membrane protein
MLEKEQEQRIASDQIAELRIYDCFKPLTDEKIEEIARTLIRYDYVKDQNIMEAGDEHNRSIYFLVSGSVSITSKDKTGKPFRYAEKVQAPLIFGEVAFFSNNQKRTATVTAMGNSVAYELTYLDWGEFKRVYPDGIEILCKQMANTLARNDEQLRKMMFTPTKLQPPDIIIRIFSSMWFLGGNAIFILVWVIFIGKISLGGDKTVDQYPYNMLGLLLGIEALIISTLILNRQTDAARIDKQEELAHKSVENMTNENTEKILKHVQEIVDKLPK